MLLMLLYCRWSGNSFCEQTVELLFLQLKEMSFKKQLEQRLLEEGTAWSYRGYCLWVFKMETVGTARGHSVGVCSIK